VISLSDIQNYVHGFIAVDEPMSKYTWIKVGGPADFYLEPGSRLELVAVVEYFYSHQYPWIVVGRGSNMLVSDDGFRGAVINVEHALTSLRVDKGFVFAESGVRLPKFVDYCVQNELAGVEMLAGIPGTIGGAIVMNAGAHGGEIADHLVEVEVIRNGSAQWIKKADAEFSYRRSGFAYDLVLGASFQLVKGDKEQLSARRRELILKRNETQPLEYPNLGSMFKNPPNMYAAKLIEQAGLKGRRIGDIQVSEKHSNFFINLGNAKATDVLQMIEFVKQAVFQQTGIMLEPEVKMVGFAEVPKDTA
jgi:UDP-N-acetylmuramate dehydrogenase